jgi:hypothetical protein
MRLEALAQALVDEKRLEDVLDPARGPDDTLDPRPPPAGAHFDEVAGLGPHQALAVDRDRRTGGEVRLPGHELAALCELDDQVG